MNDEGAPEFETGAAFNSGLAFLYELTMIRRRLHEERVGENYHKYFLLCEAYFIALTSEMKEEMIIKQMNKYLEAKDNDSKMLKMMMDKKKSVPVELIDYCKRWEIELRHCEKKCGLLMPDKSDPGMSLMGGHY